MHVTLRIDDDIPGLVVALIEATGVRIEPAPAELRQWCDNEAGVAIEKGLPGGELRRGAIRDLLRCGGFKPSGRNKPAQEYLLRTVVAEGSLPSISNVVDLINTISLMSGLPISLVSLDRVGTQLALRWGRKEERFVFNRSGQELNLEGLLCLCAPSDDRELPVANPVKDSMRAKVDDQDRHILACIYASQDAIDTAQLRQWAEEMATAMRRYCHADETFVALRP